MIKRKYLSVAVSAALATVSLLPDVGYAGNLAIDSGRVVNGSAFKNTDQAMVTEGVMKNSTFKDETKQILNGKDNNGSHAISMGDAFSGKAVQVDLYGISARNRFTDNAKQYVKTDRALSFSNEHSGHSKQYLSALRGSTAALSISDTFKENALQYVDSGVAKDARFSGMAQQYVAANQGGSGMVTDAVSQNSKFSDHSGQVVDGYDVSEVHYQGKSEGDVFSDDTLQTLKGTGLSTSATFHNHAKQLLSDTATAKGSQFNDQSGLLMTGGLAEAPTFNGQSSFVVAGGEIKNATLNNAATGILGGTGRATGITTVNNNASINITAEAAYNPINGTQAESVVLNGGSLRVILPAGNNPNPVAKVEKLTVNGGTVRFGDTAPDASGNYSGLAVNRINGTGGTLIFNTSLAAGTGNKITAGTIGAGHYNLQLNDASGSKEITLKKLVQASQLELIDVTTKGGDLATYDLVSIDGKKIDAVDLGIHLGKLDVIKNGGKDKVIIKPVTDKTTRSTDALLGALSSSVFISDGEMQNVRSRRGELQTNSQEGGGVWGRYMNNRSHIQAAGSAGYTLEQNGIELGGDKIIQVGDDHLALGLFGSYSKNNLKQDRGNSSKVDSWGTGIYATWFGAQGYYVDGVLKYDRFSTAVNAKTETGMRVGGKFDQNGLGASLETGYRFNLPAGMFVEPYVRAAYFTADGAQVTLSNGLEAKADRLQSLRGETGVSAGKRFELASGVTVSPYATVAVEHEFKHNNTVRMNDAYNFNNDFSGTTARYGVGLTSQITHNTAVYAEANYRKGDHVESPLMGNAGFRISF